MEACRLTERPFAEFAKLYPGHFIVEAKHDGERVLATVTEDKVVVSNNYGTTYDFSFLPEYQNQIIAACRDIPKPLVLDCEFVSSTPNLYQFLKDRVNAINETELVVFDVLMSDGKDVRADRLVTRKRILTRLQGNSKIRPIWFEIAKTEDEVWDYYWKIVKAKFEGVVVKPVDSIYTDGAWCKLKKTVTHDVVILGIKRTEAFLRDGIPRSFLIGFIDENRKIVPYGYVSSGWQNVDQTELSPMTKNLDRLDNVVLSDEGECVYVEPTVVVEIMAHSLLETRKFREPRILRSRSDKRPEDCKIPDGS